MPATIATTVETRITQQGLSLRQVAEGTGIKLTTLHRRLRGGAPFTYPEVVALADYLDTTVADLATEAQEAEVA